jgi:endonuclease/exonuclease/phosphatase family metal-dependent hydrolase
MAHPVRRFTKRFLILCNVLVAMAFLLGCYGYWFDPASFWFTGFFSLGAFYFLIILIVFIFFWLVAKPAGMLISITALLLAWTPLRHLVKFRVAQDFNMKKENTSLRVMSWNVEHFQIGQHKKHPEKKQQMIWLINHYQPDVACFQEMVGSDSVPRAINYLPDFVKDLKMPYFFYTYNSKLDFDKDHRFGIIVFSKYPILNKKSISYSPNDYNSIFQYVDVRKSEDTFRIFNLHLQSLKFSDEDLKYLEEPGANQDNSLKKSRNILSKFKTGFLRRKNQSEHIKEEINQSPYPVVVCGDFNDVPNSYAYATIGKGLKNSFAEKGSGIGRTFTHISPTLRIDNIFTDKRFTIQQYARDGKDVSDHFPIVADLYYNKP